MAYLSNRKRPDSVPISLPPISPNLGGNHENTQNLNNILVITKNDLDRIQGHLNKHQMRDDINHEELQRKKDLHQKSLALTRNWNNTIEGEPILLFFLTKNFFFVIFFNFMFFKFFSAFGGILSKI